MYTNIGKFLTGKIRNSDLYNFVVRLLALLAETLSENPVIASYIEAISKIVDTMEKVFSRNMKNSQTIEINKKHKERVDLLTALRRKIAAAQKLITDLAQVAVANNLKQEMVDRDWWKSKSLSYADVTTIVRPMLETMAELPFSQWVQDLELQSILDSLGKLQGEFETLVNDRIEEISNDTTPQMNTVRKKLIDVLLAMFAAIDFGMINDPQVYAEIGGYIREMIVEVNAKTLGRQTRAKNGKEKGDEETETGTETEPEAEGLEGGLAYD